MATMAKFTSAVLAGGEVWVNPLTVQHVREVTISGSKATQISFGGEDALLVAEDPSAVASTLSGHLLTKG